MTYMLIYVLLGMTHIAYYLAYVASFRHTSERTKNTAQDASVTLEAITIEVNSKCCMWLIMRLAKLNVAGF